MATLTQFFHTYTKANVHPLTVSRYFISNSLYKYICSSMHMMFILCSEVDAVRSGD